MRHISVKQVIRDRREALKQESVKAKENANKLSEMQNNNIQEDKSDAPSNSKWFLAWNIDA